MRYNPELLEFINRLSKLYNSYYSDEAKSDWGMSEFGDDMIELCEELIGEELTNQHWELL